MLQDASPVATALYFWVTLSYRLAKALSILFHPLLTAAYLLVAVTAIAVPSFWPAVGWLSLVLCLSIGGPGVYLWLRVRSKGVEDLQIIVREQRLRPLLVSLGFSASALAVVLAAGGPRALVLALSVGVANGIALTLITLAWKISFHTATLTGAVAVLWWCVGPEPPHCWRSCWRWDGRGSGCGDTPPLKSWRERWWREWCRPW